MTYALRQVQALVTPGQYTDLSAAPPSSYVARFRDISPRNILVLDHGKIFHDYLVVGAGQTVGFDLPQEYDGTERLFVTMDGNATFTLNITNTLHALASIKVKAGANQSAQTVFQDFVTALSATNHGASAIVIEYACLVIPDLTLSDNWRCGVQTTGIQGNITGSTPSLGPIPMPAPTPPPIGRSYAYSIDLNYGTTPVTTGAWVQLTASTPADINELTIADTGGEIMEIGSGPVGFEQRIYLVARGGGASDFDLRIVAGTRLSIRAVSANVSIGDFVLNGLT